MSDPFLTEIHKITSIIVENSQDNTVHKTVHEDYSRVKQEYRWDKRIN